MCGGMSGIGVWGDEWDRCVWGMSGIGVWGDEWDRCVWG